MKTWLLVAFGMFALDYVWALYTKAIAAEKPMASANWAVVIIMLSGFVTTAYIHDPWLLTAAAVGAWLGTFAANVTVDPYDEHI
jgi:hypothetical protein